MFIELSSGSMLNFFWLSDCFQGKHDKKIVIFYMINGSKVIEQYSTEAEAETRVNEVQELMEKASIGRRTKNTNSRRITISRRRECSLFSTNRR